MADSKVKMYNIAIKLILTYGIEFRTDTIKVRQKLMPAKLE